MRAATFPTIPSSSLANPSLDLQCRGMVWQNGAKLQRTTMERTAAVPSIIAQTILYIWVGSSRHLTDGYSKCSCGSRGRIWYDLVTVTSEVLNDLDWYSLCRDHCLKSPQFAVYIASYPLNHQYKNHQYNIIIITLLMLLYWTNNTYLFLWTMWKCNHYLFPVILHGMPKIFFVVRRLQFWVSLSIFSMATCIPGTCSHALISICACIRIIKLTAKSVEICQLSQHTPRALHDFCHCSIVTVVPFSELTTITDVGLSITR